MEELGFQCCNLWHTGNNKHSVMCVTINPVKKLLYK